MDKDKKDSRIHWGLLGTVKPGELTAVQISPLGEWPATTQEGRRIVQHVDGRAVSRLVENFSNEILVDADHLSETGGSTEALAWITELRADPEHGLVGVLKWTDTGAEAITGHRYRFVSASWTTDPDGWPGRLCSVALTSHPSRCNSSNRKDPKIQKKVSDPVYSSFARTPCFFLRRLFPAPVSRTSLPIPVA